MKKLGFALTVTVFLTTGSHGQPQIRPDDISVSVEGLAQKYSKLFQSNKFAIADAIVGDSLNVTTRPLSIRVFYEKGLGVIQMGVQFDNDALFDSTSKHYNYYKYWKERGSSGFISLYGVKQLMGILEAYRHRVALSVGDSILDAHGKAICAERRNQQLLFVCQAGQAGSKLGTVLRKLDDRPERCQEIRIYS